MIFTYNGEQLDSELLMFTDKQKAYVNLLEKQLSEKSELLDKAVEDITTMARKSVCDFENGRFTSPCRFCEEIETCDYIPTDGGCCFKWRGGERK